MLYVRIRPCWVKGVRSRVTINSEKVIQVRFSYATKIQSGGVKLQNYFLNKESLAKLDNCFYSKEKVGSQHLTHHLLYRAVGKNFDAGYRFEYRYVRFSILTDIQQTTLFF